MERIWRYTLEGRRSRMGLQKDLELNSGFMVEDAYFRIDTISGNKNKITLSLVSYVGRNDVLEGKSILNKESYSFTPDIIDSGMNFIRQGYGCIIINEEFQYAKDIL